MRGGVRKPILGQTTVLEDGIILDVLDRPDMRFLTSVPNCSSLAGLEVPQEPPVLEVILGECWRFLTGVLGDGDIFDVMDRSDIWFLTFVPDFCSLACLEGPQDLPVLEVILWGCWRFLTGILEDGVILDIRDNLDMLFLPCGPIFCSLACLEELQEPPIIEVILGGR